MDLEEYRRAYMQAEGIGNTPANAVKRIVKFGSDLSSIPGAVKKDKHDRAKRKASRAEAMKGMKENGVSIDGVAEYLSNRPRLHGNTSKAVERTVNSGTSVAMSVNEYGQTAAGIVGTKRSNLYDGQDLENGIRFSIKASKALNNGLKLPTKMFHAAEKLVGAGAIAGMMVLTPLREVKPERENMMPSKTKEFGKNLPDISDQER